MTTEPAPEEKPATEHQQFNVPVDKDPYDKLTGYAKRIVTLLEDPVITKSSELKSTLDELVGSIHSLIMAHHLEYEDRINKKKDDDVILGRAKNLSEGIVWTDGK